MRERIPSYIIAALLGLAGLGVLAGLTLLLPAFVQARQRIWFSAAGDWLFGSFHLAALFIPIYLFLSAGLLVLRRFRLDLILFLNSLILPFLTAALALKLFLEPAGRSSALVDLFAELFTRRGAAYLSALILAAELMLLPQLKVFLSSMFPPGQDDSARKGRPSKRPETDDEARPGAGGVRAYLPLLSDDSALNRFTVEDAPRAEADEPELLQAEAELPALPAPPAESAPAFVDDPAPEIETEPERELAGDAPLEPELEAEPPPAEPPARPAVKESQLPRRRKAGKYEVPLRGLLNSYDEEMYWIIDEETRRAAAVLKATLEEFNIQAEVTGIRKGPVITMFEILPAPGVKLSKIVNLSDNIALRLAAQSVRIVAPIPGKHAVGIEIPNRQRAIVSFAEMIADESYSKAKMEIPIALGKGVTGDAHIIDLAQTPHLLIAGATGSGKSVCVNSIVCSILFRRSPAETKLILIDPKIVELKFYNDVPHLLTPVVTEPKRAFQALQWAISEMERRYSLLDALGVRDMRSYNRKIREEKLAVEPLPYIVIVIDEFADLMATTGKDLESTLARLAAMSRAVGLHLVLATQRPSVDVITGLIKANIPSRIAFMVAGKFDSRIIIDAVGAEKLLGRGDMLFTSAWDPFPIRIQGAFLSEGEVERVVEYVKTLGKPDYIDDEMFYDEEEEDEFFEDSADDPLMEKALEIISLSGKASASYLQRRLKIGYNRAARMVEAMERRGIVGPQQGSKPREILRSPGEGIRPGGDPTEE